MKKCDEHGTDITAKACPHCIADKCAEICTLANQPKEAAGQERYACVVRCSTPIVDYQVHDQEYKLRLYGDAESCRKVSDALNNRPAESELVERVKELEEVLACAYQLAGLVDAPEKWLDALSSGKGKINDLLPVTFDDLGLSALDGVNTTQGDSSDK